MRIAFVISWYGRDIGGGAEAECRGLVLSLKKHHPELKVDVLTTCLPEFSKDWNQNTHDPGLYFEDGIRILRFPAKEVNREKFHPLNGFRLMPQQLHDLYRDGKPISPLTKEEEQLYLDSMIDSPELFSHIDEHYDDYDFFVFIPYMFGTTVKGSAVAKGKAAIIPCLHKERYAYMNIYHEAITSAVASLYHVQAEQQFACDLYGLDSSTTFLIGEQVDCDGPVGDGDAFRKKFGLDKPFLLYAGRKIPGKNLPLLVSAYEESIRDHLDIDLVIIGGGELDYSNHPKIHDLGFVSKEDKLGAMAAALALCQPSLNESFSIVMMEAWLQRTPCIVHHRCDVTKEHCDRSQGGFTFSSGTELKAAAEKLLEDTGLGSKMGNAGYDYVTGNYESKKVCSEFMSALIKSKSLPNYNQR